MPVGNERLSAGQKRIFAAGLLLLLTIVSYGPAFHAGFIWDDDTSLTANPLIKSVSGLRQIWFSTKPYDYFPLTFTSFWVEWRLWGMNPTGYHIINVLLHASSAVLLWRVLLRLRVPAAWFAAAIFAVHPICVASVAWIAERKNTLSMFFCLLSALWFLKSIECRVSSDKSKKAPLPSPFYWLSLVAFAFALLSKTSVVTLPLVLILCVWWIERKKDISKSQVSNLESHPPSALHALRSTLHAVRLSSLLPFFALSFLFGLLTVWFQTHRAMGGPHGA